MRMWCYRDAGKIIDPCWFGKYSSFSYVIGWVEWFTGENVFDGIYLIWRHQQCLSPWQSYPLFLMSANQVTMLKAQAKPLRSWWFGKPNCKRGYEEKEKQLLLTVQILYGLLFENVLALMTDIRKHMWTAIYKYLGKIFILLLFIILAWKHILTNSMYRKPEKLHIILSTGTFALAISWKSNHICPLQPKQLTSMDLDGYNSF